MLSPQPLVRKTPDPWQLHCRWPPHKPVCCPRWGDDLQATFEAEVSVWPDAAALM